MIILCAFMLAIGILIGWHYGFKRGEKALPRSIMKIICEEYKKTAREGIDKKAFSKSITKAVHERLEKMVQEIINEADSK